MKKIFKYWLFALLLCTGFSVTAYAAVDTQAVATTGKPSAQLLFVLLAGKGQIQAQKNTPATYLLTLSEVNPSVIYFTNRPQRYSGKIAVQKFLQQWQNGAFSKEPPNAVMEAVRLVEHFPITHKRSVSYTIVLQNPRYDAKKDTLTFNIHSLSGKGGNILPDMAHSDYVALFIDNLASVCPDCNG